MNQAIATIREETANIRTLLTTTLNERDDEALVASAEILRKNSKQLSESDPTQRALAIAADDIADAIESDTSSQDIVELCTELLALKKQ